MECHNHRLQSTKQISSYEAQQTAKMRVATFRNIHAKIGRRGIFKKYKCKDWPQGHDSLRSDLSFRRLPAIMHPRIITTG